MMKMVKRFAEVVVDIPSYSVDRLYHYEVPTELLGECCLGHRVYVPFGRRKVTGYVVGFVDEPEVADVKPILGLVDPIPLLTEEMIALVKWMAEYYQCLLIEAIRSVIPAGIHISSVRAVRLVSRTIPNDKLAGLSEAAKQLLNRLQVEGSPVPVDALEEQGAAISELVGVGLIEHTYLWSDPKVKPKYTNVCCAALPADELLALADNLTSTAPKQAAVLRLLVKYNGKYSPTELARLAETTSSTVAALRRKGLLEVVTREVRRDPYGEHEFGVSERLTLNPWQEKAFRILEAALERNAGEVFLLHGVTGSGKTEVYLQIIEKALQSQKTAITLVPEISLTPQMVRRYKERFGAKVAVLHSRLSLGERFDEWRRIRNGAVQVVVGARSAVFAPLQELGVIIIDEEHESSYKQEESPRYHAREVAEFRGRQTGAIVVLGSATPSLESYYAAETGKIQRIYMPQRVQRRPLPSVEVVDMREELAKGNRTIFSDSLRNALQHCLVSGTQAILLLNRRGFASFVLCRECGNVLSCPNCRVSLTYHRTENLVMCHYCGYRISLPPVCPECRSHYLRQFGAGTERVALELRREFPTARVLRMDVDTTGTKGAHERILTQFGQHKADILVGTQMVAKGLDFPNVTLVGVVTADTALNLPDFRAGERTFQLLTQVAGRAGRGSLPGRVIIQTYTPEHYSVQAAQEHNYERFVLQELAFRRQLRYPPFVVMGRLLVTGGIEKDVARISRILADWCRQWFGAENQTGQVIGPTPAPLSKLKGRYRWHVIIKVPQRSTLQALFAYIRKRAYDIRENVRLSLDIDPMSLL